MKYVLVMVTMMVMGFGCAGERGSQGEPGALGQKGNSGRGVVTIAVPATLDECPLGAGGELVVIATDIKDTGVYSGSDPIQSAFSICNGTNGQAGTNATLNLVQFCPGTPVYPSVFPEIGIKVGTTIVAVYSTNGGFLTTLTPGRYTSDAVGSRCDFTVNANGTVSN